MQWWRNLRAALRERFVAFMVHKNPFVIVIRQLLVPAILAGISVYVTALFPSQTSSVKALFTEFILALFFVMWFVGIYERAKKRTADDQAFSGLQGNVADLVGELKKLQADKSATSSASDGPFGGAGDIAPPADSSPEFASPTPDLPGFSDIELENVKKFSTEDGVADGDSPIYWTTTESRMAKAWRLAKAGFSEAALLQAGVAFEDAVRTYGGDLYSGASSPKIISLGALVRNIKARLPWGNELETLVKIRNEIAHGHGSYRLAFEDVYYVLNNYQEAIESFERLRYTHREPIEPYPPANQNRSRSDN